VLRNFPTAQQHLPTAIGKAGYDPRKPTKTCLEKGLTHREAEEGVYKLAGINITRFRYDPYTGIATWEPKDWKVTA
jgi:hypothetical protein